MGAGDRAVKIPDIVALTSLSETTVKGLISSGELPSFKVGRSRLVLFSDLSAFIATRKAAEADSKPAVVPPPATAGSPRGGS